MADWPTGQCVVGRGRAPCPPNPLSPEPCAVTARSWAGAGAPRYAKNHIEHKAQRVLARAAASRRGLRAGRPLAGLHPRLWLGRVVARPGRHVHLVSCRALHGPGRCRQAPARPSCAGCCSWRSSASASARATATTCAVSARAALAFATRQQ